MRIALALGSGLEAKAGRVISATNRDRIGAAIAGGRSHWDDLEMMLAECEPEPEPSEAKAHWLRVRRFQLRARLALLGVGRA
jgi:hypothetical protein